MGPVKKYKWDRNSASELVERDADPPLKWTDDDMVWDGKLGLRPITQYMQTMYNAVVQRYAGKYGKSREHMGVSEGWLGYVLFNYDNMNFWWTAFNNYRYVGSDEMRMSNLLYVAQGLHCELWGAFSGLTSSGYHFHPHTGRYWTAQGLVMEYQNHNETGQVPYRWSVDDILDAIGDDDLVIPTRMSYIRPWLIQTYKVVNQLRWALIHPAENSDWKTQTNLARRKYNYDGSYTPWEPALTGEGGGSDYAVGIKKWTDGQVGPPYIARHRAEMWRGNYGFNSNHGNGAFTIPCDWEAWTNTLREGSPAEDFPDQFDESYGWIEHEVIKIDSKENVKMSDYAVDGFAGDYLEELDVNGVWPVLHGSMSCLRDDGHCLLKYDKPYGFSFRDWGEG
jgi:hypothetical protein